MTRDQVIQFYGSVQGAAEELGITHQAIYAWKDKIPPRSQRLIEALTRGKLKADKKQKAARSNARA